MARPAVGREGMDAAARAAELVLLLSWHTFGDAWLLARRVWDERYRALVAAGELPIEGAGVECAALPDDAAIMRVSSHASYDIDAAADTANTAGRRASQWALDASAIAKAGMGRTTRGTWVSNLAELVAAERIGVRRAPGFWQALHTCVPTERDTPTREEPDAELAERMAS